MKKIVLIKFGGSVMVPNFPDKKYLKKFCHFIKKNTTDYRFILVVGGGGINRSYNKIAQEVANVSPEELDWIGIYATRLNARLLLGILGKGCHPKIITNPQIAVNWKEDVLIAAGWMPGWSTDYDATILAQRYKAKMIVATNTDYVYDKDPHKFPGAKPLKRISLKKLGVIVGKKWMPKLACPLDPSAIKYASKNKLKIISLNGKDIANLEQAVKGKAYRGTLIS